MDLEIYDKDKIGSCIAWTGEHSVYEYGNKEVIKFSKFDLLLGHKKALEKSIRDKEICEKFFGRYYFDTRIALSEDKKRIALIQPKIVGTYLTTESLKIAVVEEQYRELIYGYESMLAAGHPPVDLIGGKGAFTKVKTLGNIFVTPDSLLYLFDATLLDVREFPFYCWLFIFPLFTLAMYLQNSTIKVFRARSASLSKHQSTQESPLEPYWSAGRDSQP